MNKHATQAMTAAAIRDLDPAPAAVLTTVERERAEATLARILGTPGDDQVPEESGRPRLRRVLVLAGLALTGVALP
ncbi:MAG: hypothetical protein ACRCYU_12080, partial [Nocardioides sp.]